MAIIIGTNGDDQVTPFGTSEGVTGGPATDGSDIIHGGNGNDHLAGGRGSDVIDGGNGDDVLDASGFEFDSRDSVDVLDGGNGNDLLFGSFGDDSLYGGNGNDWLFGGDRAYPTGDDYLDGGRGDDLLAGTSGTDTLRGGPGADIFQFGVAGDIIAVADTGSGAGNRDVVLDFEQGQDRIDLSNYQNFPANRDELDDPVFLGTDPFGDSDGLQVRYDVEGDHTVVQFLAPKYYESFPPPLTGEIELAGAYHLSAGDFILS